MGLDITAYRQLTKLDVLFNEDGEPVDPVTREVIDNFLKVYANPDFPGRAEGLVHRAVYSFAEAGHTLSMGYGRYNGWREHLAKFAGYPLSKRQTFGVLEPSHAASTWNGMVTGGPFYELINFADNEGTIGPIVAAKLLRDFIEFDERAEAIGGPFYESYRAFRGGLELAADGGALDFH